MCLNYSEYTDLYTKKLCQQYGFRTDTVFALKSRLKNYPLSTITLLFIFCVVIFSYILRIFEAPYYRTLPADDSSYRKFDDVFISIWCCIITITTVGYGDVFAQSNPGRIVSILVAMSGAFLMALVVAIVTSQVELSNKQQLALTHVQLSKSAAETLQKIFQYFNVKKRYMVIKALREL